MIFVDYMKRGLITFLLLFSALDNAMAQSGRMSRGIVADNEVMRSAMFGVGAANVMDSYLSPYNYKGIVKLLKLIRNKIKPYRPKVLLLVDEVGMIWDNRNFKNFRNRIFLSLT